MIYAVIAVALIVVASILYKRTRRYNLRDLNQLVIEPEEESLVCPYCAEAYSTRIPVCPNCKRAPGG